MSNIDIVRAWKDEEYRMGLSVHELALVPDNPAGLVELFEFQPASLDSQFTYCPAESQVTFCPGPSLITICPDTLFLGCGPLSILMDGGAPPGDQNNWEA